MFATMIHLDHLLTVAAAYKMAAGLTDDKTVSFRAFGDSKKLSALQAGADITVGRFNTTMRWFSENWPPEAPWPDAVDRPVVQEGTAV